MDTHGSIVTLPSDSYTSLARYITSENISQLKRFSIDQVFPIHAFIGETPNSNLELAFDIVTPSASAQEDAQVLITISKVLHYCRLPVILQLSHHSLLEAILVHCQVPENERSKACRELSTKFKHIYKGSDFMLKNFSFSFSSTSSDNLFNLMEVFGKVTDVQSYLSNLPGWGGKSASLANEAFKHLNKIIKLFTSQAKVEGIHCPIFICVNTALDNYDTHSGMAFRFICRSSHRSYVI